MSAAKRSSAILFAILTLGVIPLSGTPPAARAQGGPAKVDTPLPFIQNDGQLDGSVDFHLQGTAHEILVDKTGLDIATYGQSASSLGLHFVDAETSATVGALQWPNKVTFLFADEPGNPLTGVPAFSLVKFEDLYSDVRAIAEAYVDAETDHFHLKRTIQVDDRDQLGAILFRYPGNRGISVAEDGSLVIDVGLEEKLGAVTDKLAVFWVDGDNRRRPIDAAFAVNPDGTVLVETNPFETAYTTAFIELTLDYTVMIDPYAELATQMATTPMAAERQWPFTLPTRGMAPVGPRPTLAGGPTAGRLAQADLLQAVRGGRGPRPNATSGMKALVLGGDFGGADLVVSDGDVLSGTFTNVGTFRVPIGVTAYVDQGVALNVHASAIEIEGRLDGVGRGYAGGAARDLRGVHGIAGNGPGGGARGVMGPILHGTGGGGGGHGGGGGAGLALPFPFAATGGAVYDLEPDRIDMGSGGGGGANHATAAFGLGGAGGYGGAAILFDAPDIVVKGEVAVDGTDGEPGVPGGGDARASGGGGGAGGGILLKGALTCGDAALLSADGGRGANVIGSIGWGTGGGGGAGGRVKLVGDGDVAACNASVEGGAPGEDMPGAFVPAGGGGTGGKNNGAPVAANATSENGDDGTVESVESLDQVGNVCAFTTFTFSNLTPVNILDNTASTSTILVSSAGAVVTDVDITTNITHTFPGDLDMTLTSPAGTTTTISTDNGGTNDNAYLGTLWDDDANPGGLASAQPVPPNNGLATDHTYAIGVLASPLVAEGAMGRFVGQNPNGTWILDIFDDAGGDTGSFTWSITLRTCAAAPTTSLVSAVNNVSTSILDNTTNVSTINVSTAQNAIFDVNLTTNILHTSNADLDMTLTSPGGTTVTLGSDNGGANDNVYNGTLWDDSATVGLRALQAMPPNANFVADHTYVNLTTASPLVPEEAMAAFIGENPNGTWTLQVHDDAGVDTGSFTWSLSIQAFTASVGPQPFDLAITKTVISPPIVNNVSNVTAGNNLTYRVTVTNQGPGAAPGVTVEDTLPPNTVFVSATPAPFEQACTFNAPTRLVKCVWTNTIPAPPPTQTRSVDIVVRVCPDATCNTVLTNRAVIPSGQLYQQAFATNTGDFQIINDAATTNSWHFRNDCTSSLSVLGAGHTAPGTLRWGNPTACTNYGTTGSIDRALTPTITTSACISNLLLTFKYYIDYQESTTFDRATVQVNVIGDGTFRAAALPGTAGGTGQVTLIDDTITNNPNPPWQSATVNVGTLVGSIPASLTVEFLGDTSDGIGNTGNGFVIDDVTMTCTSAMDDSNPNNNTATFDTTVQSQSNFSLSLTGQPPEVAVGNLVTYTIVATNNGPSNAAGTVIVDTLPPNFEFFSVSTSRGTCARTSPLTDVRQVVTCNVGVLGAPMATQCATPPIPDTVTVIIQARAASNPSEESPGCPEGRVENEVTLDSANCLADLGTLEASAFTCVVPRVDPNPQLDCQVHLPILNFQGQDDVCRTWIEVQFLGGGVFLPETGECRDDSAKAVLITWGEPGFCPPQAAGPLKVECTGMLVPGSAWNLLEAQIPTGSKSGILFKFTAAQLSDVGLADDLGFDDVVADLMCEELFFGVVGDADDYRRFKKAYNEGGTFRAIPQNIAMGAGVLAVDVLRHCPGDVTPGVEVSGKYNGIGGTHLGVFDPVFGGYSFYVPLLYADKASLNSIMYVQNGGLECSSVEIWFKAQDDCLRSRICEVLTLAPGESYQFDATDCVGPDWQGSAWIRASEPMGIVVDIVGRDIMMTYVAEPAGFNYVQSVEDDSELLLFRPGDRVLYGPLVYSEYQGWDAGVQVMNSDPRLSAKVKVYFLDRSGDIVTTLVDWICPRGSQTFFLPVVHNLPGNWVGSIRVESQEWWTPGSRPVRAPSLVGVATLMKYVDVARTDTQQAIAYELLPEHKAYLWQVGYSTGGLDSGVGLIAIPSFLKDLDGKGVTTEIAITNLVPKPGFTDFAIYIYDQNGLLDYVCQKLHSRQTEYIDLQTWGYVPHGFKGSAIISATFWEHDVFGEPPTGEFLRNLVGLGAVLVERTGTRLGEDIPGDEAAGARGIPFRNDARLGFCLLGGAVPRCPGQPSFSPTGGTY